MHFEERRESLSLNKLSLLASAKVILYTPIPTIFFNYLQENIIVSIVSVVERLGRVRVKTTTFHLFLRFFFFSSTLLLVSNPEGNNASVNAIYFLATKQISLQWQCLICRPIQ